MDRIWHFQAERSVELADRTEAAIVAGVEKLMQFPQLGRSRGEGGRELSLAQLQYRVSYVVKNDDVLITAVRSTREQA